MVDVITPFFSYRVTLQADGALDFTVLGKSAPFFAKSGDKKWVKRLKLKKG